MTQAFTRLRRLGCVLGALLLLGTSSVWAQTRVRIHTSFGPIDIQLKDAEAPITVTNFLAYVNGGDYTDVMFHRLARGFVLQGGGFRWSEAGGCCPPVASRGKIQNEFSATRSNLRGTVAMAKQGGDPNSATNQWFVNLANNSGNLDNQNGGFTVFGAVTAPGMAVVDRIGALTIAEAEPPFGELPVQNWTSGIIVRANAVLMQQATVLPALATQSDSDRIFTFLEAQYPQYLSPSVGQAGTLDGYTYRYYSGSNAYVGTKDGKVWYLVPAINDQINELGSMADWLAQAQAAGY
jgi:peptidyl-prolyl cis-trans isomerase A (cyclophilin A)